MDAADLNGDWPDLAVSVDLPQPKPYYTDRELAQTYATLAVHHGILWPRVVHALEYLRGHLIGMRGEVSTTAKEVKLLREALQGQIAAAALGLPKYRPEAPSTVDAVESIKTKISGEFQKIARESIGPKVEAEPQRLLQIVDKAVTEEMAKREAVRKAAEAAAELQAFKDARERRKKTIRKAAGAFVLAVATAAGTWTWGKAQGHIEGKQATLDEMRRAPTAVATVAPAPSAPAAVSH
jgi:hypothetical protein